MMKASVACLELLLLIEGFWFCSNAEEDVNHIFSSDPILLASKTTPAYSSWLTCANKECIFLEHQTHENIYTRKRKVFHIYANERSKADDPIRYGDEVALFYKENNEGIGLWLSCESDKQQCGLGTCPGLPHFKHWMWNTTSCYENRFFIASAVNFTQYNAVERGNPVKEGDELILIRNSDKIKTFRNISFRTRMNATYTNGAESTEVFDEVSLQSDSGKWIIKKDMIEKCGERNYDVRYKVCDRCGSQRYLRSKDESWQCCAGEMPYNPAKSLCCEGSVSDLSKVNRDAKEARCCGRAGYFSDQQLCCLGKVHNLPGQDTDADDNVVQCCGTQPYLTTQAVCCNNVLTPLGSLEENDKNVTECCGQQGFNRGKGFCFSCGQMMHVLPLSEETLWGCCNNKHIYKTDESKCCDYGVEEGKQCKCQYNNNTYISGERFSDHSPTSACRTCVCQNGYTLCDTVSSCPAVLSRGCSFYPANGECCPVFECFDVLRENNHQLFLRRRSHVSVKPAIPLLEALTISFWMKTEQDSEGTLLSYATKTQSAELVIRTHPTFRVTFKGSQGDEVSTNLNDGSWHFVCIQWESSSGQWSVYVDDSSQSVGTFSIGQGQELERRGHLVLGRRQHPQKNLVESDAFVGLIAYFNVWDSKIDFIDKVKADCLGLYEGDVVHWSLSTVDTHHSASVIAAEVCRGSTAQEKSIEKIRKKVFHWRKLGADLERLCCGYCMQSEPFRLRGTEHSFQLKVCSSSTAGSLGHLHFTILKGGIDSPLYWPFPFSVRLSVVVNEGNADIYYDLPSGLARRKSKAWSLFTGSCSPSEEEETQLNPESTVWSDFITVIQARNNYNSKGKLRMRVTVYTEGYGDWLYWNGHYYSHHRNKKASWFAAEATCIASGESVHLPSIHSQEENDFLKSHATDPQWIGLTSHNVISSFLQWVDGSSFGETDFKDWAFAEPNIKASQNGDCGILGTDGKWVDEPCEIQKATSETPIIERSFTCKTPGKTLQYTAPPSLERKVILETEPGVFSVDISTGDQTTKVTFITGLHYTAPNMKFSEKADKVKYAANLKFGNYVHMTTSQLGPLYDDSRQENDVSGVADLDGVVDRIEIPHYADMDRVGNPAFSIEFWIRPRRMPLRQNDFMALFSKSSSSSGSISLIIKTDGTLKFTVAPTDKESPLVFVTSIANEDIDCKVKILQFQHITVTGNVPSSLKIHVNGEVCYTMNAAEITWGDETSLPASSEGPLVFGAVTNSQDSDRHKLFNGQIAYIRIFNTERTQQQIQGSINAPHADTDDPVGSWHLRKSKEIKLIHYVISDSSRVSSLQVLEEFSPSCSSFPVVAFERNGNIHLFRLTSNNNVLTRKYILTTDKSKLQAVPGRHVIVNPAPKKAKKGCFTVAQDKDKNRLIVITCRKTEQFVNAVKLYWKVFKMNDDDQIEETQGNNRKGSLVIDGIGSLDTRPSATVVGNHLLLTAGTTNNAETLFLDFKLDRRDFPLVTEERVFPIPIGPNIVNAGITYFSYLYKPSGIGDSTSTSQVFLRRLTPQNGHSTSYTIDERMIDPNTLTANAIESSMPENDWFWFLFRISTLSGGNVIQSGQRIVIQTPDNNPQNERGWSFVTYNGQSLQADQHNHLWDFWIFKTKTCDPLHGGYTILSGDIGPDDCILLWPKTFQFRSNCFCRSLYAHPTEKQIQGARETFGSWFGPWKLMVPMQPTPVRPIPQPTTPTTTISTPRNVYEGNKYVLLHFGEGGINVPPPREGSKLRAALLRFARTTVAPVVVSNSGSTPEAKLLFRGNGGPIPVVGPFRDAKVDMEEAFNIVYREGSFAQKRMTSGLFYSMSYAPPAHTQSPGVFKNLARITGLEILEYPEPPPNFIWLVPPPFKVNGICEMVTKLFNFDVDTVESTASNSVASLSEIVTKAIGSGSFNEGLFKPLLTVHIDIKLLHEIGERAYSAIVKKIQSSLPQPPGSDSDVVREPDPRWQEVGDVEACLYMSDMDDWKNKVNRQKIEDKSHQLFNSEWMKEQMIKMTSQEAPDVMRDASKKYSSYGGIAVLIANRLRGPAFLEELLIQDLPTLKLVLQSYLPVLDAIRPDLGIAARRDILSTLLARTIIDQPWEMLRASLDKDKEKMALTLAIDTLTGKNAPPSLSKKIRSVFLSIFRVLFNPLTSTQLAYIERTMNMDKQRALEVDAANAAHFEGKFLNTFKSKYAQLIAEFNKESNLVTQLDVTADGGKERLDQHIANYHKRAAMMNKQNDLLKRFQDDILVEMSTGNTPHFRLKPTSKRFIARWINKDPRNFAKVSNGLNVVALVAATGSLILEASDPDSNLRKRSIPDIIGAVATAIGAIGSLKGVFDFAAVLREHYFPKSLNVGEPESIALTERSTDFDRSVSKYYRVNYVSDERVTERFVRYFEGKSLQVTRFFVALGVLVDLTFFGINFYNVIQDFKAEHIDAWKLVDDIGLAEVSLAGAAVGILTFWGLETGPAGLVVLLFGLALFISDTIRAKKEAEQQMHEARCKEWTTWCNWGKELFLKFGFLRDENPCATCPLRKREFMRALCLRGHISAAHRAALGNVLESGKDVRSMVPSVGTVKQKTCPAWLRHFYKRRGSHKGQKG